jgi:hypothetical protein
MEGEVVEVVRCSFFDRNLHSRMPLVPTHARSFQASMRVTNLIPFGCSLLLPVDTVNYIQTLKAWLSPRSTTPLIVKCVIPGGSKVQVQVAAEADGSIKSACVHV